MPDDSRSHQPTPRDPVEPTRDVHIHNPPPDPARDVHIHNYNQEPPAGGPGPGLIIGLVVVVFLIVLMWFMFTRGGDGTRILPDQVDIDVNLPQPTQPQTPPAEPTQPPTEPRTEPGPPAGGSPPGGDGTGASVQTGATPRSA